MAQSEWVCRGYVCGRVVEDRYDPDLNMVRRQQGRYRTEAEYGGCLPRLSVGGGCRFGVAVLRKIKSRRK
ncbi:hypothetical protein TB1_033450 [Malus domestica]